MKNGKRSSRSHQNSKFGGTGMWGVYNFSRPTAHRLGVSGSIGITECDENLAMDLNLILEKSWSHLVVVMNLTGGRAWMRETAGGDQGFLIGRLGISRDVGRSISLAVESQWCFEHRGGIKYCPSEMKMGPSLVWNAGPVWVLSGLLFDLHPDSALQGPALQLQAGVPF